MNRPMNRHVNRAMDQVSIYLPVILMGALAMGTYLLVRSAPPSDQADPAKPLTHNADYFMQGFSVKTFDPAGRLKSELQGTEMRHFPDTDTVEIDKVNLHTYDNEGRLTVATAERGLSNGDGSEVQLFGNAIVVREASAPQTARADPKLELRSDFLHVITDTELIKTHKPVRIMRGTDEFTADSLVYDNLNHLANLQGRVKGVLTPAQATGRSKR
jgi:lipopolysaccharide export system protein LptC